MTEHDSHLGIPRLYSAYRVVAPLLMLMMMVGFFTSALRWKPGAYLLIAAATGQITAHLVVGLTEYRRVMSRPWPKVRPVDDEDD